MYSTVQRERGRGTCGPTAATEWLKKHRPKVALHPNMTDYCDSCKDFKEQLSRNQAVINRSKQSGNATVNELHTLEKTRKQVEQELKEHKEIATKSREYHNMSKKKCTQEWKK